MKHLILLFVVLSLGTQLQAQRSKYPAKRKAESNSLLGYQLKINAPKDLNIEKRSATSSLSKYQGQKFNPQFEKEYLIIRKDEESDLPIYIKIPVQTAAKSNAALSEKSIDFLQAVKKEMKIAQPADEFKLLAERVHKDERTSYKYGQVYQGLPVLDAEIILHEENQQIHMMTGRYFATPALQDLTPTFPMKKGFELALSDVAQYSEIAREDVTKHLNFICSEDSKTLVIYHHEGQAALAWHFDFHPNLKEKWAYIIDAHSGEIYSNYKSSCSLHNHDFSTGSTAQCEYAHIKTEVKIKPTKKINSAVAGPFTGSGMDLLGINRPIQGYESGGVFVLADASRTMFDAAGSNMPNDPVGAIWTLDAMNTSPESNSFDYDHSKNNSSSWNDRIQVSGHYNSGQAYEYYTQVHQRNSINDMGGNIVCFVNVSEKNGSSLENAYWNGNAMFYGNGGNAFEPLARALDVAGHEISHGVVQTTANLKYENQSGAMNESFADIFGAMIDRNDWKIGEDVVKLSVFPSGALRDLANPNNGGSSLNDAGWQPKHMNEFQNLPNTPQGDNGGVHINSGITNHAFFKIATSIGKSNAEDIFYRALTKYLVRSSQFIDLRVAAERSAIDLFGNGSAQLAAVQTGFNEVGIGSGTGTNTQTELETNTGTDYILYSDPTLSNLFIAQSSDLESPSLISETDQLSKPSITDDGSFIVFIGTDKRAYGIEIDYAAGTLEEFVLSEDPTWRNIVVAKDGSKVALIADQRLPEILVYDFASQTSQTYELSNPTFTEGVSTGDVLYADVMEFDYSGEFLIYDAESELAGAAFGEFITYWDIGFMRVWNNQSNSFVSGDNNISKLFSQIPENASVGNPSFAKEADFIVTFDFIDEQGDASIFAVNTETGETSAEPIFTNSILNYPNYSIDDGMVIFDASNSGDQVIGRIDMNSDRLNATNGDAFIFLENAKWGTWYGTAERNLTNAPVFTEAFALDVFPNPAKDQINIQFLNPNQEDARIELYNVQGQLIQAQIIEKGSSKAKYSLDISEVPNGLYLVKLTVGEEFSSQKVTIQK